MARGKATMKKTSERKENENPCGSNVNSNDVDTTNNLTKVGKKRFIDCLYSNCTDIDKDIEISDLKKKCFGLEQRLEIVEKNCSFILQHMTNFQDLFNDVLQNSNNENDIIMLPNNAIVTTNNDNVISLTENIVPTNNTDLYITNNSVNLMNNAKAIGSNENIVSTNNTDLITA
ncbi:unnamed protein product, partial [Adineta steineri]